MKKKILLVEDQAEFAFTMNCFFNLAGYEVELAKTVSAGLALLSSSKFDLLVSDFHLPDGNGAKVIGRANELGIPSLLISGTRDAHDVAEAVNSGASQVLLKPFDPDRLMDEVQTLLEKPLISLKKMLTSED